MQDVLLAVNLGAVYLLFALGMSLTWSTIGILNFAHGATFMFATYVAFRLLESRALSLVPVLFIGIAVGAAMSVGLQKFVFEPILRRARSHRAGELQILIGGIGAAIVPVAVAQHYVLGNSFSLRASTFDTHVWQVGGLRISNIMLITVALALALWALTGIWMRRSRLGLALRAIGVDSDTTSLMGADRNRLALGVMAFSGALAGVSGVLFTFAFGAITADSGDVLLLKAFAVIIFGGVGSMWGLAFGAFFLAAAEIWVTTQTSGAWVEAVSFGLIFLVLLVRPHGIFGRREVSRT